MAVLNQVPAESEPVADDLARLSATANAPSFGVDWIGKVTAWNFKAADMLGDARLGESLIHAESWWRGRASWVSGRTSPSSARPKAK